MMGNRQVSYMVFSDDKGKAIRKMNQIVESWNEPVLMRQNDCVKTATKYIRAMVWSTGCRGYRYHEVYIEDSVFDEDQLDWIYCKIRPYRESWEEYIEKWGQWKWKDHVHMWDIKEVEEYECRREIAFEVYNKWIKEYPNMPRVWEEQK